MPAQAIPTKSTFDEFVKWYPENSLAKYELRDGGIVEIPRGSGDRSEVSGNIRGELSWEINRLDLPYFIPGHCLFKIPGKDTAYQPDIVVLELSALTNELRWEESSIIQNPTSVQLVVELVDEDWETPYIWKSTDYESMGIPEYWIADCQGKIKFKGDSNNNEGLASLSVYHAVGEEYQVKIFIGDDAIKSVAFPHLNLTVNEFFNRS